MGTKQNTVSRWFGGIISQVVYSALIGLDCTVLHHTLCDPKPVSMDYRLCICENIALKKNPCRVDLSWVEHAIVWDPPADQPDRALAWQAESPVRVSVLWGQRRGQFGFLSWNLWVVFAENEAKGNPQVLKGPIHFSFMDCLLDCKSISTLFSSFQKRVSPSSLFFLYWFFPIHELA